MRHFAILLAFTAVFIGHAFAAEGGRKAQIVLLKLDDVVAARAAHGLSGMAILFN